jgi:hypothetical protein
MAFRTEWTDSRRHLGIVGWITAAILVAAFPPQAIGARADDTQKFLNARALSIWKQEDACVAASIKQFPDQDIDSLRARDRSVDGCLAAEDLPPRQHIVPDP